MSWQSSGWIRPLTPESVLPDLQVRRHTYKLEVDLTGGPRADIYATVRASSGDEIVRRAHELAFRANIYPEALRAIGAASAILRRQGWLQIGDAPENRLLDQFERLLIAEMSQRRHR